MKVMDIICYFKKKIISKENIKMFSLINNKILFSI